MRKSETLGKIGEALSKAQSEIKGAIKDSNNPFYKNSYANLESVWDACRAALAKYNLSVVQTFEFEEGVDFLETTLIHSSGEWISGRQRMLSKEPSAQALGSAATYNRRYGLAAICGVVQTDDDGEHATRGAQAQQSAPRTYSNSRPAPSGPTRV